LIAYLFTYFSIKTTVKYVYLKKRLVYFNIKFNYYYIIFDNYKYKFHFFFGISSVEYFERFMTLSYYFAETAMGVDVHAQEEETKYTATIHRFEKS